MSAGKKVAVNLKITNFGYLKYHFAGKTTIYKSRGKTDGP
jgi:hypothetical protein